MTVTLALDYLDSARTGEWLGGDWLRVNRGGTPTVTPLNVGNPDLKPEVRSVVRPSGNETLRLSFNLARPAQEPVLAANSERKAGTLFGLPRGAIRNRFTIATSRIEARGVELQGGYAFGLSEGVKLSALNGGG